MYDAIINNSPTTRAVELQYLNSLNVVIKEAHYSPALSM
jgi:hypothetical protein